MAAGNQASLCNERVVHTNSSSQTQQIMTKVEHHFQDVFGFLHEQSS